MFFRENVCWLLSLLVTFLGACSTLEKDAQAGPGRLSQFYVATGVDIRRIPFGYFYGAGFTSHDIRRRAGKNDLFMCPSPTELFTILITNADKCNELTSAILDAPISSIEVFREIENTIIGIDDHKTAYDTWHVSRTLRKIEIPVYTGWEKGWAQSAVSTYAHEAMHFVFETAYWRDIPPAEHYENETLAFISEGLAELAEKACSPPMKVWRKSSNQLDIRSSIASLSGGIDNRNKFEVIHELRLIIDEYLSGIEVSSKRSCNEIFRIAQSRPHEIDADFLAEFASEMRSLS